MIRKIIVTTFEIQCPELRSKLAATMTHSKKTQDENYELVRKHA